MKVTAELRDWHKVTNAYGHSCYWGNVYDDIKGRFHDGARIHTSQVVAEQEHEDWIFVLTLNSVYALRKDNGSNKS